MTEKVRHKQGRTMRSESVGRRSFLLISAASLALGGCVSTRQVADVQFQPPQGDYSLVVMRPDVQVGSLTTGGLFEARADWTEQARANLLRALTQQQAGRGGRTLIAETRNSIPGVDPQTVADLERLHNAVGNTIAIHKYNVGNELPTKRRGLDWTLGEDAVKLGRATGMDYALFLYAQDAQASGGRVAMQVLGIAGCFVGFCAPQVGGGQFAYASLVDLKTGEVVWFNVLQTQSQMPGVTFGDIRSPEGAAQMVDRLLGRMRSGRNTRRGV
jgi:hypothetical protein